MNEKDYVLEVYKERSFSTAAKNLYITQPALSASVKKIEKELGITIFDRSTSPIALTEEGKVYIEAIEKIKRIEEETKIKILDINELRSGTIRVGGENFVSSFILPKIIMEFSNRYPGVNVEIIESSAPNLRQLLSGEAIDLLIAHDFDRKLFTSESIFEETLLLAVPENFVENEEFSKYKLTREDILNGKHLLADCEKVDLKAFKDSPFILLKKGNDTRRRANLIFAESEFEPTNVKIYLDQLITSYNMVCSGLGVAIVNDVLVKNSQQVGAVYYKISGRNAYRTMGVGFKKNKYCSKLMRAFIETAKEVYKNI
jgi:DNA-binding transcriptional LysR family regulator